MGRVYTFTCPRCEYRAHVSGGTEEGFHCVTQTIVCRDCKVLHDVAVRVRLTEADAAALAQAESVKSPFQTKISARVPPHLPPMLLFGKPPRTEWVELKPQCPTSAQHRWEAWTKPGKCPRCGMFLEQDVMPWRIWD